MNTFYVVLKTLFVWIYAISAALSPTLGGGDFAPSKPVPAGDSSVYIHADAVDTGMEIYKPRAQGGYHYGPSMILNADGSLDVWCAADGPGDVSDLVSFCRLYHGGKCRSVDRVVLQPTGGGWDSLSTCDPGVIKFGGYYYIGYTTTLDKRGVDNDICVARSKNPDGPFVEKWTGSGWGAEPVPLIEYTDNPDYWGAGEPSFVLMGDQLYIYYSWNTTGATTHLAIADATDENWPATLEYKGEVIPAKNGGDSADVKYLDEYGRFLAVFTEKRFSTDSYVAVWESFDGLHFRQSDVIKANTAQNLHNCGISGRADGHIGKGDPVYLGYGFGVWGGIGWPTRLHELKLSLADAPMTDDTAEENVDMMDITPRKARVISESITVKSEDMSYTISKPTQLWVMAYDSDGYVFPVLLGTRFYGYDKSVIRMVGGLMIPVGEGSTRVFLDWHGKKASCLVTVVSGD